MEENTIRPELAQLYQRLANTGDQARGEDAAKRHKKGYRTARENLADLVDDNSFLEYGQLAVAAQRNRRSYEELQTRTPADGIITGTATINAALHGVEAAQAAVVVNDYSVLAGTQGYFHHKKLDRICEVARENKLPVIMYTEGGGGRPGDTDITTPIAGLNVTSFTAWAGLSGQCLRIAVANGYCFAGNAALFGSADITIATRAANIGMAGPAMIEGGGLGSFKPSEIGPAAEQEKNGVVDILADDEAHATALAKQLLSYFQGPVRRWTASEQSLLRDLIPKDRRFAYPVRRIIEQVADSDSFLELRRVYGRSVITGFMRLEGIPVGVLANDCQQLGGAVDAEAAEKAARFIQLCDAFALPLVSFTDTPGFMVGPDSERAASVRRMSRLFVAGANVSVPVIAVFLRKGYGLGAMAMVGGDFTAPTYACAWPTGEFGGMGLEGAVRLGFSKELAAVEDEAKRQQLFDSLVAKMYEQGKATEAASHLELDAVIDPADTRAVLLRALRASRDKHPPRRRFVDTW